MNKSIAIVVAMLFAGTAAAQTAAPAAQATPAA
jgi:hypothetical protein